MDNSFLYRKNVGHLFNDFMEKRSDDISGEYRELVLSCSGIIKTSYFDKIEWAVNYAYKKLEKNRRKELGASTIIRRAEYYLTKKSFVRSIECGQFCSDIYSLINSVAWIVLETYRVLVNCAFKRNPADIGVSGGMLIVVSQQYQYERLVSLMERLVDNGMAVTVVYNFPIKVTFRAGALSYINIGDNRNWSIYRKILKGIWDHYKQFSVIKRNLRSYRFRRLNVPDAVDALLTESFVKWNHDHLLRSVRTREISSALLDKVRPSIVYSIDAADPAARILEKAAHDKKIKTYCMSFSFHDEYSQYWMRRKESRYGAINSSVARLIKDLTDTKYDVDVIGDPSYDCFKCDENISEEIYNEVGVRKGAKIILFISFPVTAAEVGTSEGQYDAIKYRNMLEGVILAAHQLEAYLIVKPHPVDNNNIKQIIDQYCTDKSLDRSRVQVISSRKTKDLVCASDVVVGVHSTVSFESIFLEKRYILIQWDDIPDILSLIEKNVCHISYNSSDLSDVLDDAIGIEMGEIEKKYREEYLKDMYVYPYNKSTDRFISVVDKILDENY